MKLWVRISGLAVRVANFWRLETVIGPTGPPKNERIYVEFYRTRNGDQVVTSAWPEDWGPMRGWDWWRR